MENLLKEISSLSLLGKTLTYGTETLKVGNATFCGDSLYISLIPEYSSWTDRRYHILNLNPEKYINDLYTDICILQKNKSDKDIYLDKIPSEREIVLEIKNPLLRDIEGAEEDDYEVRFNLGLDGNTLLIANPENLYRSTDPRVWNFSGGYDINKRLFPMTINNLRRILFSAMPEEIQAIYKNQLKEYCENITKDAISPKLNLLQETLERLKKEQENIETQCAKLTKTLETNEKANIDILLY